MNITHLIEYRSGNIWVFFKNGGEIIDSINAPLEVTADELSALIQKRVQKIKDGMAKAAELAKAI